MKLFHLLFGLVFVMGIGYAQNVTNTTTTTIPIFPIDVPNSAGRIEYDGETWNWVAPQGWKSTSAFGNCTFNPQKHTTLNETYTKMVCTFPWDMPKGGGLTDVMQGLLQFSDLNEIARNKEEIGRLKAAIRNRNILLSLIIIGIIIYFGQDWFYSRSLSVRRMKKDEKSI